MHDNRRFSKTFVFSGIIAFLVLAVGCAGRGPLEQRQAMDSAAHHEKLGSQFAEDGKTDKALSEYQAALEINQEYSPAHAGMARLHAQNGDARKARESLDKAIDHADERSEKINARLAEMEVLIHSDKALDIEEIEDTYDYITKREPDHPEASLLMADAYARADRTEKADDLYRRLVEKGGPDAAEAEKAWREMQARKRLESDVRATEELADLPGLTRAQTAALVVEELEGCRLLEKVKQNQPEEGFLTPSEAEAKTEQSSKAGSMPADVSGHPLKRDIVLVQGMGLRGLSARPDGRFYPDKDMTRADMALALEDLLMIAENDTALARKFIGSDSPFADVSQNSYAFNAILLTVSRGLMEPPKSKHFYPEKPVSGMDALRSIQKVRGKLE